MATSVSPGGGVGGPGGGPVPSPPPLPPPPPGPPGPVGPVGPAGLQALWAPTCWSCPVGPTGSCYAISPPIFKGLPGERPEAHLLRANDWMDTYNILLVNKPANFNIPSTTWLESGMIH